MKLQSTKNKTHPESYKIIIKAIKTTNLWQKNIKTIKNNGVNIGDFVMAGVIIL